MPGRAELGGRIVVVGDLINDVVAIPLEPIRLDTDTPSTVLPRPGGSAGNTAAWLGTLGVPTDLVAAVGHEDAAQHERILRGNGVEPHFQVEVAAPTGTIVIIVEGQNRSMLTSRGANALLAAESVTDDLLAKAAHLHVAAYSFLDGFGAAGAQRLISRAHAAGATVSFNPGSEGFLLDSGPRAFLDATAGADLLFPNLVEGRLLSGADRPDAVLDALTKRYPTVALTLGADGSMAKHRGGTVASFEAAKVPLVDPTGSGDAFAAGFLSRWVADPAELRTALAVGTHTAARAVMVTGARPPL